MKNLHEAGQAAKQISTIRNVWFVPWGLWQSGAEMDENSRPATLDDLKRLLRSLNERGVDYLPMGGYALAAHGDQRANLRPHMQYAETMDLDGIPVKTVNLEGLLLTKQTMQ